MEPHDIAAIVAEDGPVGGLRLPCLGGGGPRYEPVGVPQVTFPPLASMLTPFCKWPVNQQSTWWTWLAANVSGGDTPSAAEIVAGLASLKGDTLQGTAPPLTFATGQPHKVDCWFVGRVQGGVAQVVDGGKVSCESG